MSDERKVAVVTGSAKGLGRHLCKRLAEAGFDVVVNYLNSAAEAASIAAEIERIGASAWTVQADVSDPGAVDKLFDMIDDVDRNLAVVINNVGIYKPIPLNNITPEDWDKTLRTNLSSTFYVCQGAEKRLVAGGQVINIGVAGAQLNKAEIYATDYYISKAALLQLTRSLAVCWAPRKLRINMVSPGQLINSIGEADGAQGHVPIGRDGSFDDVWDAVHYLMRSDYVTGTQIEVAGGYRL